MSLAVPLEMETVACPCGGGGSPSEVFHTSTRRYVACPRCGLVFLNPRPSSTRVEEYYRESYDGSYGAAESSADRQPVFASVLAHLSDWRRPPGRLLDIGCGDGAFMMLCRKAGWTCAGVEVSQGAAKRARAKGCTVISPAELGQSTVGRFDVVTLVNVLESVTDPAAIVKAMTQQIKPQGIYSNRGTKGTFHTPNENASCLVRIPAVPGLFSRRNSAPGLGPVTSADSWGRRLKWRLAGSGLSIVAALAYRLSAGRLVWAPSFELIARRKDGVS